MAEKPYFTLDSIYIGRTMPGPYKYTTVSVGMTMGAKGVPEEHIEDYAKAMQIAIDEQLNKMIIREREAAKETEK